MAVVAEAEIGVVPVVPEAAWVPGVEGLEEPGAAELLFQVRRALRGESSQISLATSLDEGEEKEGESRLGEDNRIGDIGMDVVMHSGVLAGDIDIEKGVGGVA